MVDDHCPFVDEREEEPVSVEARTGPSRPVYQRSLFREMQHVVEMPALRSLGHEVLAPGSGGGYPWLREHLGSDYAPSWYQPQPDGEADASIVNSGMSRWYNYYLEGLSWLVEHEGIDGLYQDDVSYDRQIMKRVRKIIATGASSVKSMVSSRLPRKSFMRPP